MRYKKPDVFCYRLAQLVCAVVARLCFRRKVLRNEIKNAQGPFVVVANHQCAYDFVNLIGLCKRPMSFVISNSFYNSLPITGFLHKMGVLPKQQFQTTVNDMKNMKAVVDAGEPLVIYPAGLMCEDGLSTPIPAATYKFLKWLNVDVYAARISGTYFAMPKWGKGIRSGRTTIDVHKIISAGELAAMDLETLRTKVDAALMFDAYREQEELQARYCGGDDLRGLENVLYMCPRCGAEHTMHIRHKNQILCRDCGYGRISDDMGFLDDDGSGAPEIRYVSDWSRMIYDRVALQIEKGALSTLECGTKLHMIDYEKHKFRQVGQGTVQLDAHAFRYSGTLNGEEVQLQIPIAGLPTLPFSPGRYFEIQDGKNIYRCVLEDGRLVMKFINMVKIFYRMNHPTRERTSV